jgi:hypothetical protein
VLRTWESFKGNGSLGCAVVANAESVVEVQDTASEYFIVGRVPQDGPAVYYAGSAWDKAGVITSAAAWDARIAEVVKRVRTPVEVRIQTAK